MMDNKQVSDEVDGCRERHEAAKTLGLRMGPQCVNTETGRLYAHLYPERETGADAVPIHTADFGSAIGLVYYDRFKPFRFLGVDIESENLEAGRDARATWGPLGPVFQRTWKNVARFDGCADHRADAIEVIRRVKVPEGVPIVEMTCPVGLYIEIEPGVWIQPDLSLEDDFQGKKCATVVAKSVQLANRDSHPAEVAECVQRWVDEEVVKGATVLFLYVPPVPRAIFPSEAPTEHFTTTGLYWFMRVASWVPEVST